MGNQTNQDHQGREPQLAEDLKLTGNEGRCGIILAAAEARQSQVDFDDMDFGQGGF